MEGTLKNMKWKWIMAQIKKEKDEGMKITYELKREFTPLGAEGLQDEWCKSRHLRYHSLKIRPKVATSDTTHPW